jgi:Putative transmembrane protein (PGPGW)
LTVHDGNETGTLVGRFLTVTYVWARRCVVAVIGGTVVAVGVLMIVLPGPAFIVIPAGLAILGLEFACARRWLRQLRTAGTQVFGTTLGRCFKRDAFKGRETFKNPSVQLNATPPFARERAVGQPRPVQVNSTMQASTRIKAGTKTGYYQNL